MGNISTSKRSVNYYMLYNIQLETQLNTELQCKNTRQLIALHYLLKAPNCTHVRLASHID